VGEGGGILCVETRTFFSIRLCGKERTASGEPGGDPGIRREMDAAGGNHNQCDTRRWPEKAGLRRNIYLPKLLRAVKWDGTVAGLSLARYSGQSR
jgi:hypothetical protein